MNILIFLLLMLVSGVNAVAPPSGDSASLGMTSTYRYFDHPVDPDLYLVRPGDIFNVTFINARLSPLRLTVNPEGGIIDNTLAIYNVAGKTLTQVRLILREKLASLFNVKEIAISVSDPSKIAVNVNGAVLNPGLYTAYTSQHVSEIIDSAGGVISSGSRRLILFSGGPEDILVDIDRAQFLGDITSNPCLYAGYNVHVPSKSADRVQVVGEVNFPREIELTQGDNLDILLDLAGGLRSNGDRANVQIIRDAETLDAENVHIANGDIIFVPLLSDAAGFNDIVIFGAVNHPGRYSFTTNITLPKFIEAAGGFAENAGRNRTVLFRKAQVDEKGRYSTVRYPISCEAHGNKGLSDISLQPSDSVFVPVEMGYVRVRGLVRNPGYFMFVEEKDALFYIMLAGGYLPKADKELIGVYNRISDVTETHPPKTVVHDGDEVVVRIREELR
ncbi:MAG: SLBB domain-containing protein [candidate division Zixibacteria bacterium]|nr:SLBB domain-containing protein [candidate division Zixibacteria bacterium]